MAASTSQTTADNGFEAIIAADTLQQSIDTLRALVDEAKVHCHADGIGVRAIDPANVAMVDLSLNAAAFESYEAEDETLGINLSRLDDVVGMANAGDLVRLNLDPETRKLHITHGGLEYTLALIDPESIRAEPGIPDLDLSAEIVTPAEEIERGATAADLVSDHIRFRAASDRGADILSVQAEGDTDDVDLTVDDELVDATISEDAESLFSLDYVTDLKKPLDSDTEVRIELGTEFPMKWHYQFAEGAGEVTSMLAPRIQSD